jgi:hypothetical protein
VIMRLIVIRAIDNTIDLLLVGTIGLGATNLHLIVLIFKNIARIKRMNSFEHKASSWLKCRGFPCSAGTSIRRQSRLSRCRCRSSTTL